MAANANTVNTTKRPRTVAAVRKAKPDRTAAYIAKAQERDAAIAAELKAQEAPPAALDTKEATAAHSAKAALSDPSVQAQIEAALAAKTQRKTKAQQKAVTNASQPVVQTPAGTLPTPTKGQPKLSKAQLKAAKARALAKAGPKANTKAQAAKARAGTKGGYAIEPKREAHHGVTKRSAGTVGNKLWTLYGELAAKAGGLDKLLPADAKAAAVKAGYNETSAGIAFYRYRRFSGILGRVNLKKRLPKAERKAQPKKAHSAKAGK